MGDSSPPPAGNPVELIDEAAAIKLIAAELYARYTELTDAAVALLGHRRSTLWPTLPDGTEIGQFTVPRAGDSVTITDEQALLAWVRKLYPDEVVEVIRPAFLDKIRKGCHDAKAPVGPGGEADIPGIAVSAGKGVGAPRFTPSDEGRARAQAAVAAVLDRTLEQFATATLAVAK